MLRQRLLPRRPSVEADRSIETQRVPFAELPSPALPPSVIELFWLWRSDRSVVDAINQNTSGVLGFLEAEIVEALEVVPNNLADQETVTKFTSEIADVFAFSVTFFQNISQEPEVAIKQRLLPYQTSSREDVLDTLYVWWQAKSTDKAFSPTQQEKIRTIPSLLTALQNRARQLRQHFDQATETGDWFSCEGDLTVIMGYCVALIQACGADPDLVLREKIAYNHIQYPAALFNNGRTYEAARRLSKREARETFMREQFYGEPYPAEPIR